METNRYSNPAEEITNNLGQQNFLVTKIVAVLYAILLLGVLYKILPSLTLYVTSADTLIATFGVVRYSLKLIWDASSLLFFVGFISVLITLVFSKKSINKSIILGINLGFITWVAGVLLFIVAQSAGPGSLGLIPIFYLLIIIVGISLVLFIKGLFQTRRWILFSILLVSIVLFVGSYVILTISNSIFRGVDSQRMERTNQPESIADCSWMTDDYIQPRNSCYRNLAVRTQDPSLCEKIVGNEKQYQEQKDSCYSDVAVGIGDWSLCSKIDPENSNELGRCLQRYCYTLPLGSREQYKCYYDAAIKAKDPFTCMSAGNELSKKCSAELQK
ncbi:MAG: hypothetical protein M3Q73_04290 [bacterium]|nr:hypothetical protein [bacterium]